jgi:thymidine kinase
MTNTHSLSFYYGTMSSSKTANLLMMAHNYRSQKKNILLIKPSIDNRFGKNIIKSRVGIQAHADIIVKNTDNIFKLVLSIIKEQKIPPQCIFVDECNFLTEIQIDQLRKLTILSPVKCFGLRTDYTSKLFPGSKRLFEIADNVEEMSTICGECSRKAIISMKIRNGKVIKIGDPVIDVGLDDKYKAVCWYCWISK